MSTHAATPPPPAPRWWRFGMAWFAFALPASAVVASTVSAVIAIRHADPVVDAPRIAAHQAAGQAGAGASTLPAELARNHASLRH
jgi:uncharacterized protein